MNNAPRPRVSAQFVRDVRKEILKDGDTLTKDMLLKVLKLIQAGDYNVAIDLAKSHGFDLETMKYQRRSGKMQSNFRRVIEALEVWGRRPEFLNPEKPLHTVQRQTVIKRPRKMEHDVPNYY